MFGHDRFEDILAALAANASGWATKEHATLSRKSPAACKVALRLLQAGRDGGSVADQAALESALAIRMAAAPDFRTGEAVTDAMIDALFAPISTA